MKKNLILLCLLLSLASAQEIANRLSTLIFKVKPSANLRGATIRITSGELFLDRQASFNIEVYNANGKMIEVTTLNLDRQQIRQWMNADDSRSWLRSNILSQVALEKDEI